MQLECKTRVYDFLLCFRMTSKEPPAPNLSPHLRSTPLIPPSPSILLPAIIACSALLLVLLAPAVEPVPACRISEYPCRNNRCVRLDRYCDGHDDCGDSSDEPAYCTGNSKFNYRLPNWTFSRRILLLLFSRRRKKMPLDFQ